MTAVTFCVRTSCPDVRVPAICSLLPSRGPPACIMLPVWGIRDEGGRCSVRSPWWRADRRLGRGRHTVNATDLQLKNNVFTVATCAFQERWGGGATAGQPQRALQADQEKHPRELRQLYPRWDAKGDHTTRTPACKSFLARVVGMCVDPAGGVSRLQPRRG